MGDLKSPPLSNGRENEKRETPRGAAAAAAAGSHNCGAEEIPRENEFRAIYGTISRDP